MKNEIYLYLLASLQLVLFYCTEGLRGILENGHFFHWAKIVLLLLALKFTWRIASNCPLARPSGIDSIVKKSVHNTRELQSIVHLDCDPLNIPSYEKKCNLGVDILSDTTIISIRVAGRQYGTMWVTDEVSLGKKIYWRFIFYIYLIYVSYLLCTATQERLFCIFVNFATPSIKARVVKVRWGIATFARTVADFQHSSTMTFGRLDNACLDGNAGHMSTISVLKHWMGRW